jgi:glutamate-ammonia-ligase adenylyltransferase
VSLSASDLFLSPDLTEDAARRHLESLGFQDPAAADHHLQAMADDLTVRQALGAMAADLLEALRQTPDPDAALVGLSRYVSSRTARATFLQYLAEDPHALQILCEVLGTSPFLSEILIRNPEYFHWLVAQVGRSAPSAQDLAEEVDASLAPVDTPLEKLNALKRLKRREVLRIAACDVLGYETVPSATAQLSDLADVTTDRTLAVVTAQALSAEGRTQAPGAFAVIGMGKLGGYELNYSSDIDLIYVYELDDPEDTTASDFFLRLARKLTAALSEHTEESYLYRVDLRLRPMGRTGNLAYSLQQCEQYYSSWGETFERFALIKARPIAGNRGLGRRFLDLVHPFVYRRYLDHAALEEMARYKARVNQAMKVHEADRNVKVGRGGIRDIELFTQVLQLTYGGRTPELCESNTLTALAALEGADLISEAVCRDLSEAYIFLRTVEHRLQIVQEAHTHSLSHAAREVELTARRLGFRSARDLETELASHRDRVYAVHHDLFERRRGTTGFDGRQLFRILSEDLPESDAIEHLREYGLRDPVFALTTIRSLAEVASRTHAPSAARNVLANLLPGLIERLAVCSRPEQVLNRFERLAIQTGAAALFFRTLLENEGLRDVLLLVLDAGDLPAQRLIRFPELLDSLFQPPETVDRLRHTFAAALGRMEDLTNDDRMSRVRRLRALEEFKIVLEWIGGGSLDVLQEKLSLLAACCVEHAAWWHSPGPDSPSAVKHGRSTADPPWAIVALGKLGGTELTVHSDLDLVVLYDGDPEDAGLFERHQAFVEALQTFHEQPTSDGIVYQIDTRLRPEGRKGALAMPLSKLRQYLDTRAEIWERLAWTRCRPLVGSPRTIEEIHATVTAFVY